MSKGTDKTWLYVDEKVNSNHRIVRCEVCRDEQELGVERQLDMKSLLRGRARNEKKNHTTNYDAKTCLLMTSLKMEENVKLPSIMYDFFQMLPQKEIQ